MNPADRRIFERFATRVLHTSMLGVKRITDVFRKPETRIPQSPDNILLVKLWGLGALVCSTPAMAAIRQRYPDAGITLITQKGLEHIYNATGLYDTVISWDAANLHEVPGAIRSLREEIRDRQPDIAICMDGLSSMSALITHISGAKATIGFVPHNGKSGGYTVAVPLDLGCHATRAFLDLAKAAGAQSEDTELVPPNLLTNEREAARLALRQWGLDEYTLLIGINMNAGEFAMRRAWPAEKFLLLAQAIEEMGEYKTVFLGSTSEERFVTRHIKHMDSLPVNLAGRTSVRQLAAILSELHLFISNDSGPLHLAAAMDVPTVSIFGPESPERFGPPKSEKHVTIWQKPECGPCVSFLSQTCRSCIHGEECVRSITIESVREAVADMLEHLSDPDEPPWLKSQT